MTSDEKTGRQNSKDGEQKTPREFLKLKKTADAFREDYKTADHGLRIGRRTEVKGASRWLVVAAGAGKFVRFVQSAAFKDHKISDLAGLRNSQI